MIKTMKFFNKGKTFKGLLIQNASKILLSASVTREKVGITQAVKLRRNFLNLIPFGLQ